MNSCVGRHVLPRVLFSAAMAWSITARTVIAAEREQEFPYVAYVATPNALVRSGPARTHYATAKLPAGYAVEVYRHDGAGWCAIRPPDGSFSLTPVRALRMIDGRTAEVTAAGVLARVGSNLSDDHSLAQVAFYCGERVALVEPPSPTSPWVRIAPPAGEFRWIAARCLSRTPPVEVGTSASRIWDGPGQSQQFNQLPATPNLAGQLPAASLEPSDDPGEHRGDAFTHLSNSRVGTAELTDASSGVHTLAGAPPAASSIGPAVFSEEAGDDVHVLQGSPAAIQLARYEQQASGEGASSADEVPSVTLNGPPRTRFPGRALRGPLDARAAEIHLKLSQAVIAAPTEWRLAGLRDETAALLAKEQSSEVRDQLRDLLDRIAAFETIQARRQALADAATTLPGHPAAARAAADSEGGNAMLARIRSDLGDDDGVTPTPGNPPGSATGQPAEVLYDAVGTLKPVVSRRNNAPRYALVDDAGEVVSFVTASPDVRLQSYIGQRIGVRGSRGFMPEYRRAHVTASRITPLDERLIK